MAKHRPNHIQAALNFWSQRGKKGISGDAATVVIGRCHRCLQDESPDRSLLVAERALHRLAQLPNHDAAALDTSIQDELEARDRRRRFKVVAELWAKGGKPQNITWIATEKVRRLWRNRRVTLRRRSWSSLLREWPALQHLGHQHEKGRFPFVGRDLPRIAHPDLALYVADVRGRDADDAIDLMATACWAWRGLYDVVRGGPLLVRGGAAVPPPLALIPFDVETPGNTPFPAFPRCHPIREGGTLDAKVLETVRAVCKRLQSAPLLVDYFTSLAGRYASALDAPTESERFLRLWQVIEAAVSPDGWRGDTAAMAKRASALTGPSDFTEALTWSLGDLRNALVHRSEYHDASTENVVLQSLTLDVVRGALNAAVLATPQALAQYLDLATRSDDAIQAMTQALEHARRRLAGRRGTRQSQTEEPQ